jgi:outer membrane protein assembly factor BamB
LAIVVVVVGARPAMAQLAIVVDGGNIQSTSATTKPVSAFTLPTQSSTVKEAIEEFQRFVENQAWEKAFESLQTINTKATDGFVERPDGVLVPSRLLMKTLLTSMPTAGKSAYRVFYDAEAAALWEKATGAAEVDTLTQIVDNHLVSSWGDRAADRLGDLYFERGDLHRAQVAWQTVLNSCPESELLKPQLLIKVATAMALAGHSDELGEIQRAIQTRYAADMVTVAGRQVKAAEEIERLMAEQPSDAAPVEATALEDIELPASDTPLWQFRYQAIATPNNPGNVAQPFPLQNIYGQPRTNDFRIPVATDGQRVYLNTFGVEMAFELTNGKMLWRTGRIQDLNFQQSRQGALPERYSVLASGDRIWSVTRDPGQLNQQPPMFTLAAREAATGKELFNSRRAMSTWSIVGTPLVAGGRRGNASRDDKTQSAGGRADEVIYVGASRTNKSAELSLLEIDAQTFKLKRDVTVGTHAVDPNQVYFDRVSEPTLLLQRDRLYVDTHAGALLALRPETLSVEWAVAYESPPPQAGYPSSMYQPAQFGTSGPLAAGGLLFAKGMRSPRLIAIDPSGPTSAWRRPIGLSALLAGADDKRLYIGGEELAAYDLQTQELVWSTKLPNSVSWSMPVLTKNRIYQFTSRGVYEVDKRTGEVVRLFRGADQDALGGALLVTSKTLVTVSNFAVTAYSLESSKTVGDASASIPATRESISSSEIESPKS